MSSTTLPARHELDTEYTWDLSRLYPDEDAYQQELTAVENEVGRMEGYRGRLGEAATTLADFLEEYWRLYARLQRLSLYANLPNSVDQGDQEARSRAGRFQNVAVRWSTATSFLSPELLALGQDRLRSLVKEDERLRPYSRWFEKLEANRSHIRSEEVEDVLGQVGDPLSAAGRAYNSLANGEIPFAPVVLDDGTELEVARSSYPQLRMSTDREVRRKAFESYSDGFLAFGNTLTDLYIGRIKESVFWTRVRRFEDTVAEQLEPREVPRAVLDSVVDAFTRNIGVWHRYWAARRKILGVERHQEWDIFAPLSPEPPVVRYRQAVDWILEGMAPLGEEYVEPMRKGLLEERWTDVYPNRGKRDGAFATRAYPRTPFIMMSYHDDLESLSTLAHELGHAMHYVLLDQAQPLPYANYSMMMAETASNFNQALVRAHLFDTLQGENEQLALLDEAFYNFHRYFFIMPTLVRFELEAHAAVERGEGLTADRLNEMMRRLFQEGYGGEIDTDERTGITWAQFGHLYVPFYTFQYAAGIAAAAALADDVHAGVKGAVERHLAFLRAGSSVAPVEAFREAGLDMTTSEPIDRAFGLLEGYVSRLEELAARRG